MKVLVFDITRERYLISDLEKLNFDQTPVCTVGHFVDQVGKLFESISSSINSNPLWQNDMDWKALRKQLESEVEA